MPDLVRPLCALISVTDKTGVVDLARTLAGHGVELLSTGGTARVLADAGLPVREVADVTGFPEMMDGRVKTLHPMVHGGLLADREAASHTDAMAAHGIPAIDILVVNLYAFAATVASGARAETIVENIDIGGPAMIRSAAKNHAHVAVVTDPADYAPLTAELAAHGGTTFATRRALAAKAFAATAAYDSAIAGWFADTAGELFPPRLTLALERLDTLRYGENPHQAAAVYAVPGRQAGVAQARQVQGKPLSYNNLNDADAALDLIAHLRDTPAVAIIKHANPSGVALGATLADAYAHALACDPVSAFGGIVALNAPLDAATAQAVTAIFTEVVIAPEADPDALAVFAKRPNVRLLLTGTLPDPRAPGRVYRSIIGGMLAQTRDAAPPPELTVVTRRPPTPAEMADLRFAWTVAKAVKSNAVVFVKDGVTAGIGAGQMSRLDSTRIAARKAEDAAATARWPQPRTQGSVVASDAFFPFADGLLACADAGATAVIQPGGSVRDAEVIAAADARGLAMVFTGVRHFRH